MGLDEFLQSGFELFLLLMMELLLCVELFLLIFDLLVELLDALQELLIFLCYFLSYVCAFHYAIFIKLVLLGQFVNLLLQVPLLGMDLSIHGK